MASGGAAQLMARMCLLVALVATIVATSSSRLLAGPRGARFAPTSASSSSVRAEGPYTEGLSAEHGPAVRSPLVNVKDAAAQLEVLLVAGNGGGARLRRSGKAASPDEWHAPTAVLLAFAYLYGFVLAAAQVALVPHRRGKRDLRRLIGARAWAARSAPPSAPTAWPLLPAVAAPGASDAHRQGGSTPINGDDPAAAPFVAPRLPAGSKLANCLHTGHLSATFSNVEVAVGTGGSRCTFRALHRLECVWYAFDVEVLARLSGEEDDISARPELRRVRHLGALADSRHVARYVTAWCEEPACLPEALQAQVAEACNQALAKEGGYCVALLVQTELCQGTDLDSWLDSRNIDTTGAAIGQNEALQAFTFAEHLAKACREIHRAGLVRCNFRPGSVSVVEAGKAPSLKVGSAGLAFAVAGGSEEAQEADRASDVFEAVVLIMKVLLRLSPQTSEARYDTVMAEQTFRKHGVVPQELEDALPAHAALLQRAAASPRTGQPPSLTATELFAELKRLRR